MDSILIVIIVTTVVSIILIVASILIVKHKQSKKYKETLNELDVTKNSIVNVSVLTEISKVRDLVKTDNLKAKLESWDNTFNDIKEKELNKITDMISDADFLIEKKDYKGALKKISNIEIELNLLKKRADNLLQEVRIITESEERNRAIITKLKVNYRELQNRFERTRKEYGEIAESLDKKFEELDEEFQTFEKAMDKNDYVGVEKIVAVIEENINNLKSLIENIPDLVVTSTISIPNRYEEASVQYSRMIRDGYPLDYLNVEYNLKEIKEKVNTIINNLKEFKTEDADVELKTIVDYLDSLLADFDREKDSKDRFKEESKKFRYKVEKINKVVYDIYVQMDDIKVTYDLSQEEINKFSNLNKTLEEINEDFKTLLEHSKGKTFAYSKLVEELDGLNIRLSRLQDDLDYQLRSITSMKDDEYRAKEQLDSIKNLLKQAKNKIKDYKLPVIPSSYFVELREAQDAIREITKELEKKPIVIKILNIRVDNARDLVFKIYNKTNDMIKLATTSEDTIIYANRYRSSYPEVDNKLDKASALFYKGQYDKAYNEALSAINLVENNN